MDMLKNKKLRSIILVLSPLILLLPAIYNGFPFYYYDLADYLYSAFMDGYNSAFRPAGYAYFLRAASFNYSLWFVALSQAVVGSYLIFRLLKIFFKKNVFDIYLSALIILSLLSSLSWFASFLMPDIFIGFGAIAVFILIFEKSSWLDKLLPVIILIISAFSHTSNPPILAAGILGLIIIILIRNDDEKKRLLISSTTALIFILSSVALIKISNWQNSFAYNHASHAFIMGRLEEIGVLPEFLEQNCQQKKYELCSLYQNFHKDRPEGFLWEKDSPLMVRGWIESKEEYDSMIKDIFQSPKYRWQFLKYGLRDGLLSLTRIDINDFNAQERERYQTYYLTINQYFPGDVKAMKNSIQFQSKDWLRRGMLPIFIFTIIISLLTIIASYNKADRNKKLFVLMILIIIFANAIITSALSTAPSDRYTARIAWLIPLSAIIIYQRKKPS